MPHPLEEWIKTSTYLPNYLLSAWGALEGEHRGIKHYFCKQPPSSRFVLTPNHNKVDFRSILILWEIRKIPIYPTPPTCVRCETRPNFWADHNWFALRLFLFLDSFPDQRKKYSLSDYLPIDEGRIDKSMTLSRVLAQRKTNRFVQNFNSGHRFHFLRR